MTGWRAAAARSYVAREACAVAFAGPDAHRPARRRPCPRTTSGAGARHRVVAAGDNPGLELAAVARPPAFDAGFRSTRGPTTRAGSAPRGRAARRPGRSSSTPTERLRLIEAVCDPPDVAGSGSRWARLGIAQQLAHDRPDLVARAIDRSDVRAQDRVHPRVGGGGDRAAARRDRAAAGVRPPRGERVAEVGRGARPRGGRAGGRGAAGGERAAASARAAVVGGCMDEPQAEVEDETTDAVLPRRGARGRRAVGAGQAVEVEADLRRPRRRDARGAVGRPASTTTRARCCRRSACRSRAVAFSEDESRRRRRGSARSPS